MVLSGPVTVQVLPQVSLAIALTTGVDWEVTDLALSDSTTALGVGNAFVTHLFPFRVNHVIYITKISQVQNLLLSGMFFQAQNAPKSVFQLGILLDPSWEDDIPFPSPLEASRSRRLDLRS